MFRPIMAIKQPQEEIPTFIFQNQLLNCTQLLAIDNRSNRELMHRDLYINTPRSDIQTPLNRNRNLKMAIIGRNMQFHIRINIFSNQLCCSTIFSSLSLVTHTTGMTHLTVTYTQITSSHPYATVYQHLFQYPHRINTKPQHITLAQEFTNFQ